MPRADARRRSGRADGGRADHRCRASPRPRRRGRTGRACSCRGASTGSRCCRGPSCVGYSPYDWKTIATSRRSGVTLVTSRPSIKDPPGGDLLDAGEQLEDGALAGPRGPKDAREEAVLEQERRLAKRVAVEARDSAWPRARAGPQPSAGGPALASLSRALPSCATTSRWDDGVTPGDRSSASAEA